MSAADRAQAGDVREAMSALADGELGSVPGAEVDGPAGSAQALDRALACWRDDAAAREAWSTYHTIGDVLRSQDLAHHAGGDEAFLGALRARLAQEPVVLAPDPALTEAVRRSAAAQDSARRRARWRPPAWLGASAAVAGVAAVATVVWLVQLQPGEPEAGLLAQAPAATSGWAAPSGRAVQPVAVQAPSAGPSGTLAPTAGAAVLDDYLRVHRGSPRVPEGYELQGAVRRLSETAASVGAAGAGSASTAPAGAPPQQLQAVYQRGAQRVSLFIDPVAAGQPREPLALRAGATTVLMLPHEQGAFVTVMGEVPLPTLQQFAGALRRHP